MGKSKKKKSLAGQPSKKDGVSSTETNPFELRYNRRKHEVLGQKIKGEVGRRGRARDADIAKRKKTLLVEMKNKNKTNEFFDKRFGEYDENISAEEKMLMRFQHERAKSHQRNAMFQLDDGEDMLTHHGQALGDLSSINTGFSDEEEMEDEDLSSAANVGKLNFGGFESKPISFDDDVEQPEKKKTHKEIMMEVVAKSKMHKMERQEIKRKNDEMTEDVDAELASIRGLLLQASNVAEVAQRAAPKPKQDEYDRNVRELLYEAKGKATDRLKTPEEIAQNEFDRLKKLETARLARMRGDDVDSDDEASGARKRRLKDSVEFVGTAYQKKAPVDRGRMVLQHNDGDGSAKVVMQREDGTLIEDEKEKKAGESSDDSDSDDSDSDEESDEDEDEDEDDVDEEVEEEEEVKTSKSSKSSEAGASRKRRRTAGPETAGAGAAVESEVPFTFKMPESHEAFLTLVNDYDEEQQLLVISRIIACHNIRLLAVNRALMQTFFGILVEHVAHQVNSAGTDLAAGVARANALARPLYDVTQQVPKHAAACMVEHLQAVEATLKSSWAFPSFGELMKFKIVSALFPTSDMRHKVVTPAYILLGSMLSQCTVANANDVVSGLFVVSMCIEYATEAERFFPEALVFHHGVLLLACGGNAADNRCAPGLRTLMKASPRLLHKAGTAAGGKAAALAPLKMEFLPEKTLLAPPVGWQVSVVGLVLSQAAGLATLYKSHASQAAIFAPLRSAVERMGLKPKSPLASAAAAFMEGSGSNGKSLWPLTLQAHKPVPLNSIEPDFKDIFTARKGEGLEKEEREMRKLKALHKKEMRGAIREIRKDAKFVANVKQKERDEFEQERNVVVAKYENQLAQDQGAYNTAERLELKRKGKLK